MRVAWVLVLAACGATAPDATTPGIARLTPVEHLERASLALRGVRPSLADLRLVEHDADMLPEIVDRYLTTPEFGATVRELHNEALLLRHQLPELTMPPFGDLAGVSFTEISRSMYEEPLRLIEDIVLTDQPYTRIVTADYTMANSVVAAIWGLAHDGPDAAWTRTHRHATELAGTDDIGILTSPALFMRYRSAATNYHRGRANALSRALLCHDFLEGDVELDTSVDLANPAAVRDAVTQNPACAACHQTLNPLASYFFGYAQGTLGGIANIRQYPVTFYAEGNTSGWFLTTNRPPSYFGDDAPDLAGLARAIADDPRFARCAAIDFASYLTQRDRRDLDPAWIAGLQTDFVAHDTSAKQLARAIVLSDEFAASYATDDAHAEVVGYHKVRPQQLARMIEDLTGYRWHGDPGTKLGVWDVGDVDYLDDDVAGYRVLEGGIDAFFVTTPVHTFNSTSALVERAAAERAAAFVVAHDASAPVAKRKLFTVTDVATVEPAAVRRQLVALHARIYGHLVEPDNPEVDDTYALFDGALAASGDAARAWTITLVGMLSDLRALTY